MTEKLKNILNNKKIQFIFSYLFLAFLHLEITKNMEYSICGWLILIFFSIVVWNIGLSTYLKIKLGDKFIKITQVFLSLLMFLYFLYIIFLGIYYLNIKTQLIENLVVA